MASLDRVDNVDSHSSRCLQLSQIQVRGGTSHLLRQYLSYFYSNLDIDGDNDAEVSENEEDEPEAAEIDPRYADEGEEDQPARAEPRAAQRPPGQPPGPWDDERWTEVAVEDNPIINRRRLLSFRRLSFLVPMRSPSQWGLHPRANFWNS